MITWVHSELLAWGEWAARTDDRKGDYPDRASFADATLGAGGFRRDAPFERIPADFRAIDDAIRILHPDRLREVVILLYKRRQSLRRAAAQLDVSHQTIVNHRDLAQQILARLIAKQHA